MLLGLGVSLQVLRGESPDAERGEGALDRRLATGLRRAGAAADPELLLVAEADDAGFQPVEALAPSLAVASPGARQAAVALLALGAVAPQEGVNRRHQINGPGGSNLRCCNIDHVSPSSCPLFELVALPAHCTEKSAPGERY